MEVVMGVVVAVTAVGHLGHIWEQGRMGMSMGIAEVGRITHLGLLGPPFRGGYANSSSILPPFLIYRGPCYFPMSKFYSLHWKNCACLQANIFSLTLGCKTTITQIWTDAAVPALQEAPRLVRQGWGSRPLCRLVVVGGASLATDVPRA